MTIYILERFIYFICVSVLSACVYSAHRSQERASHTQELQSQAVGSCHVGARNQPKVLRMTSKWAPDNVFSLKQGNSSQISENQWIDLNCILLFLYWNSLKSWRHSLAYSCFMVTTGFFSRSQATCNSTTHFLPFLT